jgi:RNA polymerase sigma-70 factor (ECF subfamily)
MESCVEPRLPLEQGLAHPELEARLEALLAAHGPGVGRVAGLYARGAADRADLVQEIWFGVWRALPGFRGECSERTFVFRVAHNRGISHSMARRRDHVELDAAGELVDLAPGPERLTEQEQARARLFAAVRRLPPSLREPVALKLEGFSDREIAEVLGITENNAAVRLTRARAALRTLLQEGHDGR